MRIIYQQGFSHLYGLALCTLLNISVSSGALSSRRSDRLAPGTATDTGSAKHAAGYITIMKTTWERTPPSNTHTHTITVTGACTHDARKHTHGEKVADTGRGRVWHEVRWSSVSHHRLRLTCRDGGGLGGAASGPRAAGARGAYKEGSNCGVSSGRSAATAVSATLICFIPFDTASRLGS